MENKDEQLEIAYQAGTEIGATWSTLFSQYLFDTDDGIEIRKELSRDFLQWQKITQNQASATKILLNWRELLHKLFPKEINVASLSNKDKIKNQIQIKNKSIKEKNTKQPNRFSTASNIVIRRQSTKSTSTARTIKFKNTKI